jgi:hypothetical protein
VASVSITPDAPTICTAAADAGLAPAPKIVLPKRVVAN